ncbi:PfkB family carbohydrate kinase [Paenibacillus durus]|uniref:PfkB family carbohydrate kinase n=2 Tax=Paenibacillus durus TaxID=44251 RepID=UPI002D21AE7F|nr:PfkB family carbohydrate kinase [Paenibacillus durus]
MAARVDGTAKDVGKQQHQHYREHNSHNQRFGIAKIVANTSADKNGAGYANARELEELTGMTLSGDDDVKAAAEKLIAEGRTEAVIVSLGAKGAFMISKEGAEHISAPQVPVVSVVGAGDSLVAGVVYRLEQGGPLAESVRFGIAAGAAAVMNPERELCKREDTERLFESMMQD